MIVPSGPLIIKSEQETNRHRWDNGGARMERRGMDMARLIAFYSRAGENYFGGQYRTVTVGNTEKVANQIAEAVGGTLFPIRQKVPYAVAYETCIRQAKADQQANARPELADLPGSLDGYEEIYLGYPNYWGDMPYLFVKSSVALNLS